MWIGPLYRSPMRDYGYDVEDFRTISPEFGTMKDFEELLAEMHNRGRDLWIFLCGSENLLAAGILWFCFHQV